MAMLNNQRVLLSTLLFINQWKKGHVLNGVIWCTFANLNWPSSAFLGGIPALQKHLSIQLNRLDMMHFRETSANDTVKALMWSPFTHTSHPWWDCLLPKNSSPAAPCGKSSLPPSVRTPAKLPGPPDLDRTIFGCSSTRPGKHTKNHGKSPCLMGKSTINGVFSIAMLNYQRLSSFRMIRIDPQSQNWDIKQRSDIKKENDWLHIPYMYYSRMINWVVHTDDPRIIPICRRTHSTYRLYQLYRIVAPMITP